MCVGKGVPVHDLRFLDFRRWNSAISSKMEAKIEYVNKNMGPYQEIWAKKVHASLWRAVIGAGSQARYGRQLAAESPG